MASHRFRCAACKRLTESRVKGQRYCGREKCQKARKNAWRRDRYAADADYRANQAQSTKAWLDSVGGAACYHRQYRKRRRQCSKPESQTAVEPEVVPVVPVGPWEHR